jgi:hypothetical protein
MDPELMKAKIEANSPYNDGWTRQFYQEIVDEYEHINDDPHDGWWLRPEWQDERMSLVMDRNTRHSVDKSNEFINSGMTLITDLESDKYLGKSKNTKDKNKRQQSS